MTAPTGTITTLVVDDDADMRLLVRSVLRRGSIEVVDEAANGTEAIERYAECSPEPTVVLLDNQMPDLTGLEVARHIRGVAPEQLIVLFSAYLSDAIVAEAREVGIHKCVPKSDALKLSDILRTVTS